MLLRLISLIFMSLATTSVMASGIDISLGNDSAEFVYLFDSDTQVGIGGNDIGASIFFNDDDDVLATFKFLVTGNAIGRNRSLQLGAGAKAYIGLIDNDIVGDEDTIAGVGVGGKIAYIFPAQTPMALSLEGYIAPDITSFGDNKDIVELLLRFELEVAPSTRIFIGYRDLEAEIEDLSLDYEFDESAHIGVRVSF